MGMVVILAWSTSDKYHTDLIQEELAKLSIKSEVYFWSAHKNTDEVLRTIRSFSGQRVIFVTVAWRSNALSWVCAWNTDKPVIACPPFKDKLDYMLNINSTLIMPSATPVMTILEPNNVALSCERIFNLTK